MTARSVLILSDRAANVSKALERDGWTAATVEGNRAGLDAVARHGRDLDLVVTDLRMVHVDAFEVIEVARAVDRDLPVVVIARFGDLDDTVEALRRGAFQHVVTPTHPDELVLVAARAFEHRVLVRRLRDQHARLVGIGTLRDVERHHIALVLDHCNGNKTRAAEILGIDPSTLYRRLRAANHRCRTDEESVESSNSE